MERLNSLKFSIDGKWDSKCKISRYFKPETLILISIGYEQFFFYGHVALKASRPKSCCPKSWVMSPSFFSITSKNINMTYIALFDAWSGVALNSRKFTIKRRRLNNVWQEKEEEKKMLKKWHIFLIRHDSLKWVKFQRIAVNMSWIKNIRNSAILKVIFEFALKPFCHVLDTISCSSLFVDHIWSRPWEGHCLLLRETR